MILDPDHEDIIILDDPDDLAKTAADIFIH